MEKLIKDSPIWALALAWVILQLLQAWLTPIHYDEAYYWMYSQQLDWGYFDHPPAVAFLIWLSSIIFPGILGVRALSIVLQLISFYLIWETISEEKKNKIPFVLLIFCLPFFHLLGWITTPDVPLLFSASLFFYFYRRVLAHEKILDYIFWGVSMAALIYSKYHGGLLILLVLFSNLKLFLNPKTYLAGILGLALWSPHILWQVSNDFPTFRYHLQERAGEARWYFPLEYLGNLIVVVNPFLLGFIYKLFRRKNENAFERTLYFVVIGFLAFFLFQSFRDHVQPQWLVLTYFPILILLLISWQAAWNKRLTQIFWISLPLVLTLRLALITDVLPADLGVHRNQEKMKLIKKSAGDLPVMFINSYKDASLYTWYQNQEYAHSFNTAHNRKNQFNLWSRDSIFDTKKVFLVGANYKALKMKKFSGFSSAVHRYLAYDKIQFDIAGSTELLKDQLYISQIELFNPYSQDRLIDHEKLEINYQFFDGKKRVGRLLPLKTGAFEIPAKSTVSISQVVVPEPRDKNDQLLPYTQIGFSIQNWPWPHASILKKFEIDHD